MVAEVGAAVAPLGQQGAVERVAAVFGVRRGLPLLPNKRATFVIGTDRRVLKVITSEVNMVKHADLALEALRA